MTDLLNDNHYTELQDLTDFYDNILQTQFLSPNPTSDSIISYFHAHKGFHRAANALPVNNTGVVIPYLITYPDGKVSFFNNTQNFNNTKGYFAETRAPVENVDDMLNAFDAFVLQHGSVQPFVYADETFFHLPFSDIDRIFERVDDVHLIIDVALQHATASPRAKFDATGPVKTAGFLQTRWYDTFSVVGFDQEFFVSTHVPLSCLFDYGVCYGADFTKYVIYNVKRKGNLLHLILKRVLWSDPNGQKMNTCNEHLAYIPDQLGTNSPTIITRTMQATLANTVNVALQSCLLAYQAPANIISATNIDQTSRYFKSFPSASGLDPFQSIADTYGYFSLQHCIINLIALCPPNLHFNPLTLIRQCIDNPIKFNTFILTSMLSTLALPVTPYITFPIVLAVSLWQFWNIDKKNIMPNASYFSSSGLIRKIISMPAITSASAVIIANNCDAIVENIKMATKVFIENPFAVFKSNSYANLQTIYDPKKESSICKQDIAQIMWDALVEETWPAILSLLPFGSMISMAHRSQMFLVELMNKDLKKNKETLIQKIKIHILPIFPYLALDLAIVSSSWCPPLLATLILIKVVYFLYCYRTHVNHNIAAVSTAQRGDIPLEDALKFETQLDAIYHDLFDKVSHHKSSLENDKESNENSPNDLSNNNVFITAKTSLSAITTQFSNLNPFNLTKNCSSDNEKQQSSSKFSFLNIFTATKPDIPDDNNTKAQKVSNEMDELDFYRNGYHANPTIQNFKLLNRFIKKHPHLDQPHLVPACVIDDLKDLEDRYYKTDCATEEYNLQLRMSEYLRLYPCLNDAHYPVNIDYGDDDEDDEIVPPSDTAIHCLDDPIASDDEESLKVLKRLFSELPSSDHSASSDDEDNSSRNTDQDNSNNEPSDDPSQSASNSDNNPPANDGSTHFSEQSPVPPSSDTSKQTKHEENTKEKTHTSDIPHPSLHEDNSSIGIIEQATIVFKTIRKLPQIISTFKKETTDSVRVTLIGKTQSKPKNICLKANPNSTTSSVSECNKASVHSFRTYIPSEWNNIPDLTDELIWKAIKDGGDYALIKKNFEDFIIRCTSKQQIPPIPQEPLPPPVLSNTLAAAPEVLSDPLQSTDNQETPNTQQELPKSSDKGQVVDVVNSNTLQNNEIVVPQQLITLSPPITEEEIEAHETTCKKVTIHPNDNFEEEKFHVAAFDCRASPSTLIDDNNFEKAKELIQTSSIEQCRKWYDKFNITTFNFPPLLGIRVVALRDMAKTRLSGLQLAANKAMVVEATKIDVQYDYIPLQSFPKTAVIEAGPGCGKTTAIRNFILQNKVLQSTVIVVPSEELKKTYDEMGYTCTIGTYPKDQVVVVDEFWHFETEYLQTISKTNVLTLFIGNIDQWTPDYGNDEFYPAQKYPNRSYKTEGSKLQLLMNATRLTDCYRYNQAYFEWLVTTFRPTSRMQCIPNFNHQVVYVHANDAREKIQGFTNCMVVYSDNKSRQDFIQRYPECQVNLRSVAAAQGMSLAGRNLPALILYTIWPVPKPADKRNDYHRNFDRKEECRRAKLFTFFSRSEGLTYVVSPHDYSRLNSRFVQPVHVPDDDFYLRFEKMRKLAPGNPNLKWYTLARSTLHFFAKIHNRLPESVLEFGADEGRLLKQFPGRRFAAKSNFPDPSIATTITDKFLPAALDDIKDSYDLIIVDIPIGPTFTFEQYKFTIQTIFKKSMAKVVLTKFWTENGQCLAGFPIHTFFITGNRSESHILLRHYNEVSLTEQFPGSLSVITNVASPKIGSVCSGQSYYGIHNSPTLQGITVPTHLSEQDLAVNDTILRAMGLQRRLKSKKTSAHIPPKSFDNIPMFGYFPHPEFFEKLPEKDCKWLMDFHGLQEEIIYSDNLSSTKANVDPGEFVSHFLQSAIDVGQKIRAIFAPPTPDTHQYLIKPLYLPVEPEKELTAQNFHGNKHYRAITLARLPYTPTAWLRDMANDLQGMVKRLLMTSQHDPNFAQFLATIPAGAFFNHWKLPRTINSEDIVTFEKWASKFPSNKTRSFYRATKFLDKQITFHGKVMTKWDETLMAETSVQRDKRGRCLINPSKTHLVKFGPLGNTLENHFRRHFNMFNRHFFTSGASSTAIVKWCLRYADKIFHFKDVSGMDSSYFHILLSKIIEIAFWCITDVDDWNYFYTFIQGIYRVKLTSTEEEWNAFVAYTFAQLPTGHNFTLLINSICCLLIVTLIEWILQCEIPMMMQGDDHNSPNDHPNFQNIYSFVTRMLGFKTTETVSPFEETEYCSMKLYRCKPIMASDKIKTHAGTVTDTKLIHYIFDWECFRCLKCLTYSTMNPVPIQKYIPQFLKSVSFHSSVPLFSDYYHKLVAQWGVADNLESWFLRKFPEQKFKIQFTHQWQLDTEWWEDRVKIRYGQLELKYFRMMKEPSAQFPDFHITVDEGLKADNPLPTSKAHFTTDLKRARRQFDRRRTKNSKFSKLDYTPFVQVLNARLLRLAN